MSIERIDKENNGEPIFFISTHCTNDEKLKSFNNNKILCEEIVSFDCGLFDMVEIEYDDIDVPTEKHQFLAIIKNPKESKNELMSNDTRFVFAGYDLVEELSAVSAITNCGAEFDLAINYECLNSFGLISSYKEAVTAKELLEKNYPYEFHADCIIVEIWRYS